MSYQHWLGQQHREQEFNESIIKALETGKVNNDIQQWIIDSEMIHVAHLLDTYPDWNEGAKLTRHALEDLLVVSKRCLNHGHSLEHKIMNLCYIKEIERRLAQ